MIFASPLFLLGLLSVAIPIAVHFFNFHRYRKVYFSNTEYLAELQTQTRRQSVLRQLLILLARCLAIVFLVLAFAQPTIPNRDHALLSGGTAVSVYIDNSFSMENVGQEGPLVEQTRQKACEIVSAYPPGTRFQLLTNDALGHQFRWLSADEFLAAVDLVEISPRSPALSSTLTKMGEFLNSSHAANKFAFVISDFQQSMCDFAQSVTDSSIDYSFVPLSASAVGNIFIDSLWFDAPAFYSGGEALVSVRIQNDGASAVESLPVRLYVDGRQRALASVDIPSGASAVVPLHLAIDQAGILNCWVETNDYPITFDDRMYFTINVSRQRHVLAVGSRTSNPYLAHLFGADTSVSYSAVTEQAVDFSSLASNDLVILDELAKVPSGLAQSLREFVSNGGSLLVVSAEQPDLPSYNQMLALFGAPQLVAGDASPLTCTSLNADAPLYRGVFQRQADNLELPTVSAPSRLKAGASTVALPILMLPDGTSYLACTPCGSGCLYLFAAPLRTEFTNFVKQALFVPTLYNMALFSHLVVDPYFSLDRLEPITLPESLYADGEVLTLSSCDTSFQLIPELRRTAGRILLQLHNALPSAGNYRLDAPSQPALVGLSFNYSRSESVMRFCSRSDIADGLAGRRNCTVISNPRKPLDQHIRQRTEGTPLCYWCLALCLVSLLAEVLLIRIPQRSQSKK